MAELRTSIAFETAAPKCGWLNRTVAIGPGRGPSDGRRHAVFEVL